MSISISRVCGLETCLFSRRLYLQHAYIQGCSQVRNGFEGNVNFLANKKMSLLVVDTGNFNSWQCQQFYFFHQQTLTIYSILGATRKLKSLAIKEANRNCHRNNLHSFLIRL